MHEVSQKFIHFFCSWCYFLHLSAVVKHTPFSVGDFVLGALDRDGLANCLYRLRWMEGDNWQINGIVDKPYAVQNSFQRIPNTDLQNKSGVGSRAFALSLLAKGLGWYFIEEEIHVTSLGFSPGRFKIFKPQTCGFELKCTINSVTITDKRTKIPSLPCSFSWILFLSLSSKQYTNF